MRLGLHPCTPIGIDVGASAMKAVQLRPTRSGWRVQAIASVPRAGAGAAPTHDEASEFVSVLYSSGFVGSTAVVGAPMASVKSAVLDLPPRGSGAPVESICQAEASRMFRLAAGTFEMHSWELPTASERATSTQMAVSAYGSETAEALIEPFDDMGLEVVAIDLAGEALTRSSAAACTDEEGLSVLVDMGMSGLGLVVFRQGECVYERRLQDKGLAGLVQSVENSLNISARSAGVLIRRVGVSGLDRPGVDAVVSARLTSMVREHAVQLLRQVLGSVGYVLDRFHGDSVSSLRLVGGGAGIPDLPEYLAELSGLDVKRVGPSIAGLECTAEQDRASLMTAIGHAMWKETP